MKAGDFRLDHTRELFVGGEWVRPSTDRTFDIVHPADAVKVMTVAEAREADMDRAIESARTAFDEGPWPRMSVAERSSRLLALAEALDKRRDDLTLAHTIEIGIPISAAAVSSASAAGNARATAAFADRYAFTEERHANGGVAIISREPVGVVAAIIPWNLPAHLGMIKLCPALLAGCTVVAKPSPEAPLDLLVIAEAFEAADLPPGVLSILPADRDIGDRLIRDRRIDKVSFTGSTAAGRHIGAVCMDRVARVSLELGGKSAAIVLDDLPVEQIVPTLVAMSTLLNGQACMALTRVLVSKPRKAELVDALSSAFAALKVGDPFDVSTRIGPLANGRQRDRVETYIAKGLAEGAKLAAGGKRPAHLDRGFYVEPTVFTDVENSMMIAQEEIFGPVVSIIGYDDVDEAIAIANDSIYGLNGAVFTGDADRAYSIARRVRSGSVCHNGMGPQGGLPFGGFKQSGFGREGSLEALDLYTEVKAVYLARPASTV